MPAAQDLVNRKFGRLTVLSRHPFSNSCGKVQWECICECGNTLLTNTGALTSGNTKSCGCQRSDSARETGLNQRTHGLTGTSEYKAWQSMRDRCSNPDVESYHSYGGRNISVCERWSNSFENFYEDMGPKPDPNFSLDRIDVNGNYEPSNCRWVDILTQASNKTTNVLFQLNGQTLTQSQIAKQANIPVATLVTRLKGGYTIEEAVSMEKRERLVTYNGITKNLAEWAKEVGLPYGKLYQRYVVLGWGFDRSISEK